MAREGGSSEEDAGDLSISQEIPMSFQWVPKVTQEQRVVLNNSPETIGNQQGPTHFCSNKLQRAYPDALTESAALGRTSPAFNEVIVI